MKNITVKYEMSKYLSGSVIEKKTISEKKLEELKNNSNVKIFFINDKPYRAE